MANTWAMPVRMASSSSTTRTCRWLASLSRIRILPAGNGGQQDPEKRAPAHFALYLHRAPVCFHQALDQGQSQTRTDHLPGLGMLDPIELVEDPGEILGF